MIPAASELIGSCAYLARRFGWERPLRPNMIRSLGSEAAALSRRPAEEPAAIFYAFSRSFHLMAEDYTIVPIVLASNHAARLGYTLRARGPELVTLKREVSAGLLSFEEVRRWFEARLTFAARAP